MKTKPFGPEDLTCSFCGKGRKEVRKIIAGPLVYICDECVGLCSDIIAEEGDQEAKARANLRTRLHELEAKWLASAQCSEPRHKDACRAVAERVREACAAEATAGLCTCALKGVAHCSCAAAAGGRIRALNLEPLLEEPQ